MDKSNGSVNPPSTPDTFFLKVLLLPSGDTSTLKVDDHYSISDISKLVCEKRNCLVGEIQYFIINEKRVRNDEIGPGFRAQSEVLNYPNTKLIADNNLVQYI